jgi:elongation factor Ts
MAEITAKMVQQLRAATDAGVLECKKSLEETNGDFDAAVELLRKKGLDKVKKKAQREANEGIIGYYVHNNNKVASIVKLNCETDFVARNERFQQLARDLAMHITASSPIYVERAQIPQADIEREKALFAQEMASSGKPAEILERIIQGKIDKWLSEVCLMEQPFIKNPEITIQNMINEAIASIGENIKVGGFSRLQIGE